MLEALCLGWDGPCRTGAGVWYQHLTGSKSALFPAHAGLRQGCSSFCSFFLWTESRCSQNPGGVQIGDQRISPLLFYGWCCWLLQLSSLCLKRAKGVVVTVWSWTPFLSSNLHLIPQNEFNRKAKLPRRQKHLNFAVTLDPGNHFPLTVPHPGCVFWNTSASFWATEWKRKKENIGIVFILA